MAKAHGEGAWRRRMAKAHGEGAWLAQARETRGGVGGVHVPPERGVTPGARGVAPFVPPI